LLDGSVGQLDVQQNEVASILRDNGVKLQKLIENLLTFSAWQTHTAALELSEFELKPMVFSVLSQHRLALSNKKIKLQLAISAITVLADEGKLKLVLENLLSNAIKFTPEGGRIEVRAVPVGGMVEISVSDTGVGIAPEDQEAIFEEFRQVGTTAKKVEGTGLGLALSRKFVELHGGRIRVESQTGAGSTFTFAVPICRGE